MQIRQEVEDPNTENRIRSLLVPREYTRVDEIIDLVFSTAEDLLVDTAPEVGDGEANLSQTEVQKDKPVSFNSACAARISNRLSVDLTKQSRITFADADREITVTCAVSKEYYDPKRAGYWFAFHPHQLEKLQRSKVGYAAFGCGSPDHIALLPISFLELQLGGMNQTRTSEERSYWHVQIYKDGNQWVLRRRKDQDWPDITDKMLITET